MEQFGTVEHRGCSHDEQRPFYTGDIPSPHGFHQVHLDWVVGFYQGHVYDTQDEGRDGDNHGEDETDEETALFVESDESRSFFDRGRVVDFDGECWRIGNDCVYDVTYR